MTIKEAEQYTGLPRSVIRFYEKEKLIIPERNESNGYREYTEENVELLKKIAFLRTLDISINDIKKVISHQITLQTVLKNQETNLEQHLEELESAKAICSKMAEDKKINIDNLNVEQYANDLENYWDKHERIFRLDSVSFVYMFGGTICWGILTLLTILAAIWTYPLLPQQMPVQWSHGEISSTVSKQFVFVYPLLCVACRYPLKQIIYVKLIGIYHLYGEIITDYIVNYICFVILSVEIFTLLYVYGVVRSVVLLLAADTIVLIGALAAGIIKMNMQQGKTDCSED